MSSHKKHHYVPKLLLKQFSGDGKQIDVFNITSRRTFPKVSIRHQCYENFYYGKDPVLEKAFSELESLVSEPIRSLAMFDLEKVSGQDIRNLRHFILYQHFRTKSAAERLQRFTNAAMNPVIKKIARSEGLAEDLASHVNFQISHPQLRSISAAAGSIPAMMDLSIKIMTIPDDATLIISDNPVVIYNQFAEHHPTLKDAPGSLGLANVGIQIFMPISPITCICLYDEGTYQYGKKLIPVGKMSKKDVFRLNVLQAVYAEKCLYWHPSYPPPMHELNLLLKNAAEAKAARKNIVEVSPDQSIGTKRSQLIKTHGEDVRIDAKFSFAQEINMKDFSGFPQVPVRSQQLYDEIQAHRRHLNAESGITNSAKKDKT